MAESMSNGVNSTAETILQATARHLNCLSEENRNTRKKAIEGIRKETLGLKTLPGKETLQTVFNELLRPLLKIFSDQVEKNRELSITLLHDASKLVMQPLDFLPNLIPVLVQRLGQQDIVETSEELRLVLVEILTETISYDNSDKRLHVYLDDYIKILIRTIVDPYPEVKKASCKCAAILAKRIPAHFHMQSESLIKPLLQTISHQHSKVRKACVESIGNVILYGNGKSVDDVVSHLAQRLFDQSPVVRLAVINLVGEWLLDLPDRYSFHHKLIPLLMTGMSDEMPEIQQQANALWHDVGMKYEQENENDLKDRQDFMKLPPSHYPPGVERPNLGCRTLIFRHVSKILPALVNDLSDWVAATRVKSSQLLYHLIINGEEYVTQHLQPLLSGLVKACQDKEKSVVENSAIAAKMLGYYVDPNIWCNLVLPIVQNTQSIGSLMVLANLISGSDRQLIHPKLSDVCNTIVLSDICQTLQPAVQIQLLNCVENVIVICDLDCKEYTKQLFTVTITVLALMQSADDGIIQPKAISNLEKLAKINDLDSVRDLYNILMAEMLDTYKEQCNYWTSQSVDRVVFDKLLLESGPVIGDHLDDVVRIFLVNLDVEKDPELRLRFFSLLSKLIMSSETTINSKQKFGDFATIVVRDMILPNCVWRAGRVAGAIRSTAMASLWALFKSETLTPEKLSPLLGELQTRFLSLMEDDNKTTRLTTCRVLTRFFLLMGTNLNQDQLHNMYPELLKRLDDSDNEIRVTVSKTFLAYFDCFENGYNVGLYKAHLEAIYKGLLVHLDDPEADIQAAVMDVLKKAGSLAPSMLKSEVDMVKNKHRSPKYCDALTVYLQELNIAS